MARIGLADIEKMRQFAASDQFRSFEREIEGDIAREAEDRKLALEDARRTREKKARRRRLKKQASMAS